MTTATRPGDGAARGTQEAVVEQEAPISIATLAARASEVVALFGGLLYGLGLLRLSGELATLGLSTPTALSGFAHLDVLMKGVGVLVSHSSSTLVMLAALVLFVFPGARGSVNASFAGTRHRLGHGALAVCVLGAWVLLLAARWWEGVAYVAIVIGLGLAWYLRGQALTRLALMGVVLLGVVMVGVLGSYADPPPLMEARAMRDDEAITGLLVGRGSEGEWYLATREDDGHQLHVLGGVAGDPSSLEVLPADDHEYRILAFQIRDEWLG
jgi:hypothetical protein